MCDRTHDWELRWTCHGLLREIPCIPTEPRQAAAYHAFSLEFRRCLDFGAAAVGPLSEILERTEIVSHCDRELEIIQCLAEIGDPAAAGPLLSLLQKGRNSRAVALALERIGYEPRSSRERAALLVASGDFLKCAELGTDGLAQLVPGLCGQPPATIDAVARVLHSRCGAEVIRALAEKLEVKPLHSSGWAWEDKAPPSANRREYETTVQLLGGMVDARALSVLVALLRGMPHCVCDSASADGMWQATSLGFIVRPAVLLQSIERLLASVSPSDFEAEDLRMLATAGPYEYIRRESHESERLGYSSHSEEHREVHSCDELRRITTSELSRRAAGPVEAG